MAKLTVFNFITLNGFYKGQNEDVGWHRHGEDEADFAAKNSQSGNTLLFGRVTYQMMAGFWPTPMAAEHMPEIAKGMNSAEKIVFSRTLQSADWNNTRIVKDNIVEEVSRLKETSGKDMTILGSGSIVTQFAEHGLIDCYQIMIDPVAIGKGTSIFNGLSRKLDLKLVDSRIFKSGIVLLTYEPMG